MYDVGCGLRNKSGGRGNIFRYNYVHDCVQASIHLGVGSGTGDHVVHNNVLVGGETGVDVRGNNNPHDGSVIYNNTIHWHERHGVNVDGAETTNIVVYNNIISKTPNQDLIPGNPTLAYADYNAYYLAGSATPAGSNNVEADPEFVAASPVVPEDFKLQPTSPCVGAGRYGENIGAYATGDERIGRL